VVILSVLLGTFIATTTRGSGGGAASNNTERVRNGTAQGAVKGGTLNILGGDDVDYLDPNVTYYSAGYAVARLYSRQLFTNPADPATSTTAVPDLADSIPTIGNGGISPDGKTYTITVRQGAQWNTSPPRPVTAADVVVGIKRTCNPTVPFSGLSNYKNLIVGFAEFCDEFAKVAQDVQSFKRFIQAARLSGVVAIDDRTVVFTLNSPATYFVNMLTLPAMSPAPVELLDYMPGSTEIGQNMIADGPYKIDRYEPAKRIELSRNPAWNAASDAVRGAFVDKIVIDQTLTQEIVQQLLQAGSAAADLQFDVSTPDVM
jgi:peptide/nickel transport system substrate-binding protein